MYVYVNKFLNSSQTCVTPTLNQALIGSAYRGEKTILLFRENTGQVLEIADIQRNGSGINAKYTWIWKLLTEDDE